MLYHNTVVLLRLYIGLYWDIGSSGPMENKALDHLDLLGSFDSFLEVYLSFLSGTDIKLLAQTLDSYLLLLNCYGLGNNLTKEEGFMVDKKGVPLERRTLSL